MSHEFREDDWEPIGKMDAHMVGERVRIVTDDGAIEGILKSVMHTARFSDKATTFVTVQLAPGVQFAKSLPCTTRYWWNFADVSGGVLS